MGFFGLFGGDKDKKDTFTIVVNRTGRLWNIAGYENRRLMLYSCGVVEGEDFDSQMGLSFNRLPSATQLSLVKLIALEGLRNGTL